MQAVSVWQSSKIMLKQDFHFKRIWKQLLTVFLAVLLVLGQETAAIFFLSDME